MMTLDGFVVRIHREIDWHVVDGEFNPIAEQQFHDVDLFLFGRATYELMAYYLPTEIALRDDPRIANKMNALSKIVYSRTLNHAAWNNTRIMAKDLINDILSLKQRNGKDIAILGSAA